jgi:hypothetical protein
LGGWKNPLLQAVFDRGVPLDAYPLTRWRAMMEIAITGSSRGMGRLGADTWLAVRDKTGARKARVWERYPGSNWGGFSANCSVLAPGPDGPVATQRFEALREGAEDSEARIVIEAALADKASAAKLGPELAKRCEELLSERLKAAWRGIGVWQAGADFSHEVSSWRERSCVTGDTWYVGSGWQERSQKLYSLAGEVEKKLAGK